MALAMAHAADEDNWEAVGRLLALVDDPAQVATLTGEPIRSFVEWKPGQSKTGEAGYVSEGGQFRKDKPEAGSEGGENREEKAKAAAEVFAKGALDHLPDDVKRNPGVMAKLGDAALTAAAKVYGKLVLATPLIHKAVNLLFDATDDPRVDFAKVGYNPTLGTAGHDTGDPVRAQLGISAHLASTIATKVLGTALFHFRKRVLGHFQGADADDWTTDAAKELADLFTTALQVFGIEAPHDWRPIADLLEKKSAAAGKMADGTPQPSPTVRPAIIPVRAKPAPSEVALAGQDGAAFAKLLGQSKAYGVRVMADVVAGALRRFRGRGQLLSEPEVKKLSEALAAVNSTAELLGRVRVRERADRATVFKGDDQSGVPDAPFSTFADESPGILATPETAVAFFMSRRPELGIDPDRFGPLQRRQAFTLARSANKYLTARVQTVIGGALRGNKSDAEATAAISEALAGAGVTPKNPQYAEMVFRTNAMDAFQQGMYDEGRHDDVAETFPCWQYLIVDDDRTGDDHRPKGNKFYPAHAAFSAVRGDRPFNCRCSLRWVDQYEWERLRGRGMRTEDNW